MSHQEFLHPPARAIRASLEEFSRRAKTGGVEWGCPQMDARLVPMMGGDLVAILARPGHGKTTLAMYLAREVAGKDPRGIVVYATWETLVEEFVGVLCGPSSGHSLEDIARGTANLLEVRKAVIAHLTTGISIFGRSMENIRDGVPSLDDLHSGLCDMEDDNKPPKLVIVDYLQRLPGVADTRVAVADNLEKCKNLALRHAVPFVVLVQARREVDDVSGIKLPSLRDGQWSSNVEQTSDKVIGITRPGMYSAPGTEIRVASSTYLTDEKVLCMRVLKQRWGKAGNTLVLSFDPVTLSLGEVGASDVEF